MAESYAFPLQVVTDDTFVSWIEQVRAEVLTNEYGYMSATNSTASAGSGLLAKAGSAVKAVTKFLCPQR